MRKSRNIFVLLTLSLINSCSFFALQSQAQIIFNLFLKQLKLFLNNIKIFLDTIIFINS